MISHQVTNSLATVYNSYAYRNTHWQSHVHRSFELITVLTGRLRAKIQDRSYTLQAGQSALIPPYVTHSFDSDGGDESIITVFSGSYVPQFLGAFNNKCPADFAFVLSKTAKAYLFDKLLYEQKRQGHTRLKDPQPLAVQAALGVAVGEFLAQCQLVPHSQNNTLLFQILKYIEDNFAKDISLKSLSQALNYNYSYLSRSFKAAFGVGFCTFLNQYRVEKAKLLMDSTTYPLSRIAWESGFTSIRSFNRCFLALEGRVPGQYRHSGKP